MEKVKTIQEQLEEIAAEICDKYCRYTHEGQTETVDGLPVQCDQCPLTTKM